MRTLRHAAVFVIGGGCASPSPVTESVVAHPPPVQQAERHCTNLKLSGEGARYPILPMEVAGSPADMYLDTARANLALGMDSIPTLAVSDRTPTVRGNWGRQLTMIPLEPADVTIAGLSTVYRSTERLPVEFFTLTHGKMAGIVGIGPIAALASRLSYRPPGRICLSGPRCTRAGKPWTRVQVGEATLDTLIDTGAPHTAVLRPNTPGTILRLPGGLQLPTNDIYSPRIRALKYADALMDGRRVDAIIGWKSLRALSWDWDVCQGTMELRSASSG